MIMWMKHLKVINNLSSKIKQKVIKKRNKMNLLVQQKLIKKKVTMISINLNNNIK